MPRTSNHMRSIPTIRSRVPRGLMLIVGLLGLRLLASAQVSLGHDTLCGGSITFPTTTCAIPSTGRGNALAVAWPLAAVRGATTIFNSTCAITLAQAVIK